MKLNVLKKHLFNSQQDNIGFKCGIIIYQLNRHFSLYNYLLSKKERMLIIILRSWPGTKSCLNALMLCNWQCKAAQTLAYPSWRFFFLHEWKNCKTRSGFYC